MPGVSKLSWRVCWNLLPALVAGALLASPVGRRTGGTATPPGPLDDWDIPRLVAFLNDKGLGLRMVATPKDGVIGPTAFLTTTARGWDDFNRLPKDPRQIDRWQGILYCERGPGGDAWSALVRQWGDCCLVVGPFLFFGDPDLLARVCAALAGA
jgi:hypothetical protein